MILLAASLLAIQAAPAIARNPASGMTRAREAALARFEREAADAPATMQPWADRFADRDLGKTAALRVACHQYWSADPAKGKQLFDVFYQRKETR